MRLALALVLLILASCYQSAPDPEAFTYRIVWPWDSAINYAKGDMVTQPAFTEGGPMYESLQDDNLAMEPPRDPAWPDYPPTPGWELWWRHVE